MKWSFLSHLSSTGWNLRGEAQGLLPRACCVRYLPASCLTSRSLIYSQSRKFSLRKQVTVWHAMSEDFQVGCLHLLDSIQNSPFLTSLADGILKQPQTCDSAHQPESGQCLALRDQDCLFRPQSLPLPHPILALTLKPTVHFHLSLALFHTLQSPAWHLQPLLQKYHKYNWRGQSRDPLPLIVGGFLENLSLFTITFLVVNGVWARFLWKPNQMIK